MDVTQSKHAEIKRQALSRLTDLLHTLDRDASELDISYIAAEILGQTLDVSRAGYGLMDPATETISIQRVWNAPGVSTISGVLHLRTYGSYIGDLKRGETVVVNDSRIDRRTADSSLLLESISARSFINMPLHEERGFVALVFVNHRNERRWSAEDSTFIREVAERTRDAIERQRAERQLAKFAASLERQVAERTAELVAAEEALRQSQKMEAVGQLTGGIAHDFNNLLTGISGSLERIQMLCRHNRAAEVSRYIDAAQGAARRAAALTHRLLAFSRRQTLDPRPTDVNALVSSMEELIRRTVGPEIRVRTTLAPALRATMVDASQLENALLNLCINARDAMPEGGQILIETGTRTVDAKAGRERDIAPGEYVFLAVSDTGTGMTQETIDRAFEPFFTTKPIGSGTGLGLSMIYGFARQSGGQVRIHSAVGSGTSVTIFLPSNDQTTEREFVEAEASELPRAGNGETILVVDDEVSIRMLVTETLAEAGYEVLEAHDAPSAMALAIPSTDIDLLVTDVGLPGMNGRQLADAIRAQHDGLRILFITGYAESAVLHHGDLEAGMHIITKPFTLEAFANRVKEVLAQPLG